MALGPFDFIEAIFEDRDNPDIPGDLLTSVEVVRTGTGTDERRWENGYTFRAKSCGPAAHSAPCRGASFTPNVTLPIVSVMPFTVSATFQCDTRSLGLDERRQIAAETLGLYEGIQVERELWAGTESVATFASQVTAGNTIQVLSPFLRHVPPANILNGGAAIGTVRALGLLADATRDALGRRVGVIHATPDTVTAWQNGGNLRIDNEGRIRDIFGNVIIAGGGYTGSGPVTVDGAGNVTGGADTDPTDGTAWAYATGPVGVRLGVIEDVPETMGQALNRETNDVVFTAYRTAGVAFSPCAHFAVRVDLCRAGC